MSMIPKSGNRFSEKIMLKQKGRRAMAILDYTMTTAPQFVGRELGETDWVTVDQDRIDQFAACTGDRQWIHVDVERAKRESPFGGPIAHGYLSLSLVAAMVMELGVIPPDAASALNYGLDKVRFIAPVKAGARVRMRASLASAEPQNGGRMLLKLQSTLEIEGEAKPALVAEVLCMLIGKQRVPA
jgi:acyl dehydratase